MTSLADVYMCSQEADVFDSLYWKRCRFLRNMSLVNGEWNLEEISQDTTVRIPVLGNQKIIRYSLMLFFMMGIMLSRVPQAFMFLLPVSRHFIISDLPL